MSNLDPLRHSAAHLLAAAVLKIWPDAKPALGPPIENGFYYDFDFGKVKISSEDLPKIEMQMHQIAKSWTGFKKDTLSPQSANKLFKGNSYKLELINELISKNQQLTAYSSGNFTDLCRGGHVKNPAKELKHFKLLSIAGAYWRGDEHNPMLTRIYGTIFPTQKALDQHLRQLEQAKLHDHRLLGKQLDLFVSSDLVGKGLPSFTPKGATIRRELERFVVDEELKRGYLHVNTPHLAKTELYKTSGHYPYYKDTMYPVMKIDDDELILRPMTCPHHFMLYKSRPHSYRELPARIAEIASQFRYEKSGELSGLTRVRTFTLADAHIICTKEQAKEEIKQVLDLIDYVNEKLGLKKGKDYRYRLSLGDRNDNKKYYKDNNAWDKAEKILRDVLKDTKAPFFEAPGEAAFYGPKIDIQMKKVNGQEETAFTVQYDFVMPKRFELSYINQQGNHDEPIVIHRSSIGCLERTIAFLIEHYAGAFPTWLSPTQVKVLPITDKQLPYAKKVHQQLCDANIRSELDDRSQTLSAKIRDAELEKVPYVIIIGQKEQDKKLITIRTRNGDQFKSIKLGGFLSKIQKEITSKSLNLINK
jgi:threonyl-tRNA synthetase